MSDRQFLGLSLAHERRQQAIIALATASLFGAGELMGTVLAVIVGRRGSAFAVSMVLTAYFFGQIIFSPFWGALLAINPATQYLHVRVRTK